MLKMNLQTFADEIAGKIDRKYMAHFLDASFGEGAENYVRLGNDLEEYKVDLNPSTESKTNILGETTFKHNGYETSSEAEPYYATVEDPLFKHLQLIVDTLSKDDTCKTKSLEVHLWEGDETAGFTAVQQECYVVPKSYGGDISGYQIPFTVYYVGTKVKGKYIPSAKKFTAD